MCWLRYSCTVYERKTRDCAWPWTLQHKSWHLCLLLWCLPGFITYPLYYSVTNSTGATQRFSANQKTSSEQRNWSSFISDQSQMRVKSDWELKKLRFFCWNKNVGWPRLSSVHCNSSFSQGFKESDHVMSNFMIIWSVHLSCQVLPYATFVCKFVKFRFF